jgi:hypothetical protein
MRDNADNIVHITIMNTLLVIDGGRQNYLSLFTCRISILIIQMYDYDLRFQRTTYNIISFYIKFYQKNSKWLRQKEIKRKKKKKKLKS